MKAEYINPFLTATTEVLRQMAHTEFSKGAPYLKNSPFPAESVIIVVGITGEIRGQAVISMDVDTARNIASAMMMGMPVPELDDLARSALSELGNMIMGNSATLLFNEGVNIDITPPNMMMGDNLQITSSQMKTIGIPLKSEIGNVNLDISVKE